MNVSNDEYNRVMQKKKKIKCMFTFYCVMQAISNPSNVELAFRCEHKMKMEKDVFYTDPFAVQNNERVLMFNSHLLILDITTATTSTA